MKQIIVSILFICAFQLASHAQQEVKSYYIYEKGGFMKLLEIPSDTTAVPAGRKTRPHIAYLNHKLYLFNPTFGFWMLHESGTGGGTGGDTTSTGGGGLQYNSYVQEFQGNSTGQFTINHSPVTNAHVSVMVNGVFIPPSCWTRTVNTIQISQGCTGYAIDPDDGIVVIYHSLQ